MVIIRSILKVVIAIIAGYIVGWLSGAVLGAFFGVLISFFIRDIVLPNQAVLISILLSLTLGSLLSLFASRIFNTLFETNINSFIGAIPGALIGLVIVVFVYGYIDVPDPDSYHGSITVNRFTLTPIMFYSTKISSQIGATVFPIFSALGIIRETIKSHLELRRNREFMKNLPPSQNWGLPEIPKKTETTIQAKPTTHLPPSPQSPIKSSSTKDNFFARLLLFSVKTFVIACIIGIILSILGWQLLGWDSSAQFSDGFFLASAVLAMLGYFNLLGEHKVSRNSIIRYGETTGDMNIYERTRLWVVGAENSFTSFPYIFLISAYLFGFSILISIIFNR